MERKEDAVDNLMDFLVNKVAKAPSRASPKGFKKSGLTN